MTDEAAGSGEFGWRDRGSYIEVGQAMTRRYIRLRCTNSVQWTLQRFVEFGVDRAIVVGDEGQPIGYMPVPAFFHGVLDGEVGSERGEFLTGLLEHMGDRLELSGACVRDVMLPIIETYDFVPLIHAAARMVRTGIDHAFVRSGDGTIVGVLTMKDVVACLVKHFGYGFTVPSSRPSRAAW